VEELVNSATHGLGLLLSVAGLAVLVVLASFYGNAWHIVTCGVYGATLVLLYAASTCYHGVRSPRAKGRLRTAEQAVIFLLVAGTYTPFTLVVMAGAWGWSIFGVVWGLAISGILLNTLYFHRSSAISILLYLGLGWLSLVALIPLKESIPLGGLLWLVAGGIAYSAGVVFLARSDMPYSHGVWHLFVLAGSTCHYLAVFFYVLPW
jgi:hemolysin III